MTREPEELEARALRFRLPGMSLCPKCGSPQDEWVESCTNCGVIIAKWKARAPATPHAWLGRYEYRMVQVAEHIVAKAETLQGDEAAVYLEEIVNQQAYEGWEFYRIDEMKASIDSPAIFGTRSTSAPVALYVITFRREKQK